jgi:two-component system response regulator FlrC
MAQSDRKGPILVVDDDPDIREAIVDTLEDEGYQVVQTPGGREALAYLRGNPPPALIFLDWNMTPMNATQFMDEFCKEPLLCKAPVILVTADVHASQKATTGRYDGFITKPIDLETLFSTVARFIEKK